MVGATTARAHFVGPYLQVQAGGFLPDDVAADDPLGKFNLEFSSGFAAGLAAGYELDPAKGLGKGRVELAYSYLTTSLDKADFSDGKVTATGDMTMQMLLCNVWGVYRNKTHWTPYYGGGLGLGWATVDDLRVTGQPFSDDDSYGLAYQLGVGVDYALREKVWLDLGYRFQGIWDLEFSEAGGSKMTANIHGHSLTFGLRIGF